MKSINWLQLAGSIIACQAAGLLGSIFTFSAIPTWYVTLAKPALNPPSWIFGPVWISLYTLMGIALYLIWQKGWEKREVKAAIAVFVTQLILNSGWSIIFFGLKELGWALLEIVILLGFIAASVVLFYRINRWAAYLLLPYLAWSSFATYLTWAIWSLNP